MDLGLGRGGRRSFCQVSWLLFSSWAIRPATALTALVPRLWQVQCGMHQTSGPFPLGPEQAAEGGSHNPQPPSGQQSQSANTYQGYQEAGERLAEPAARALGSPPTSLPDTTRDARRPFPLLASVLRHVLISHDLSGQAVSPCPFIGPFM